MGSPVANFIAQTDGGRHCHPAHTNRVPDFLALVLACSIHNKRPTSVSRALFVFECIRETRGFERLTTTELRPGILAPQTIGHDLEQARRKNGSLSSAFRSDSRT